ncbi:hypothetical protein BDV93DRAFT_542484 [Ceratobasidium sp. AG-I]|nr:hypothetical protein BDV93DRAFT_542484 [Ceratobasidium sp. AG-I]
MPKDTRRSRRQESNAEPTLSQSSNFDGNEEAMSILIKAQATVAKNKRQKEVLHLKDAKQELERLLGAAAEDFAELVGELEELYKIFQKELVDSHDRESKHWLGAVAEQGRFKDLLGKLAETCQEEEETREKGHIDALALARSSMNAAESTVSKAMLF